MNTNCAVLYNAPKDCLTFYAFPEVLDTGSLNESLINCGEDYDIHDEFENLAIATMDIEISHVQGLIKGVRRRMQKKAKQTFMRSRWGVKFFNFWQTTRELELNVFLGDYSVRLGTHQLAMWHNYDFIFNLTIQERRSHT